MVQRFSEGYEGIYPDDNGPLVEYEDYAALARTLILARPYIELDAQLGDAQALWLLQEIDKDK